MSSVTDDTTRCPKCGAFARPDADWCTLCYAALRTPAVPEVPLPETREPDTREPATAEPVSGGPARRPAGRHAARASAPSPQAQLDPLTAPLALLENAGVAPGAGAEDAADDAADDEAGRPYWPCTVCGAEVPLDESACPECGGAFLDRAIGTPDSPLVGFVLSKPKPLLMIGGSLGLVALLLLAMYVFGSVF